MKTLLEKTDENHPLTINELSAELTSYGIKAERKTIYGDLELLTVFGLDIVKQRSKSVNYFIANRLFELPELKLESIARWWLTVGKSTYPLASKL
jgi:predicted DNA-binding transcriptional regulator YafY